ncbi:hypothetical protein HS041_13480 [Planomonospora sp. ID67723]|uniref:hypothetical protein n=1 Tax=Planomonospora sp. ID67723 TaxID=2738134 RepID=UPI0018C43568|nr:hypothetical protein [Planomonospora sp. ID67723]MBG0828779.1 hypothetical protein [Planomonospora sp. ID67723]
MVGHNDTLDFLAGDRKERAILRHMVLSLIAGLALGALGEALSRSPGPLHGAYDPYAYILMAAVVGRSAAGLGWAVLSGALAALGPVLSMLGATFFLPREHILYVNFDGMMLNIMLLVLTSIATMAHLTKYGGLRGDVAAGLLAGIVAIEGVEAVRQTGAGSGAPWSWGAPLVIVILAMVVLSLREGTGRIRAALVGLIMGTAYLVFSGGV